MDIPNVIVATLAAIAGPAASIKVAAFSAGRTIADLEKRLETLSGRLNHLENTEPQEVAAMRSALGKLREDIGALGDDVAALRTAHDALQKAVEKTEEREEKRREKAGERAEQRERRERDREVALAERMSELGTLVRGLLQELRDVRDRIR